MDRQVVLGAGLLFILPALFLGFVDCHNNQEQTEHSKSKGTAVKQAQRNANRMIFHHY